MHELSIARAVVDTALRHAGGQRVTSVALRVGALRQIVPDSLAFYFEVVARDTSSEGARLDQEAVPARLRCRACEREWDPSPSSLPSDATGVPALPVFRCPGCGRPDAEIVRGDELEVESIEVIEAPAAAGAGTG